ncbi:hypothetical protein [Tuwongella immobilis]|uniref:Uncharacterized protein n=1 Tax=Tuwongella immobilis TaxID=692036 RepID=A0A6C2YV17_9BACT|nr:hypothetical protein [Tuwongella immobilis]VIP05241.1 unnamed protein product [Tuwongella immobilis]VTS07838.1 unnamed protein product [Tuwongella immobilis]
MMTRDEWSQLFRQVPQGYHASMNLVLKNGEISVEQFILFEPDFIVLRGRVAGTTDEGRCFFVPYDQIVYARIERMIKAAVVAGFFGSEPMYKDVPAIPEAETPALGQAARDEAAASSAAAAAAESGSVGKNNILEMIRNAKLGGGNKPTGK